MAFLKTFIPVFVAIDIFAVLGVFLSLTEGMSKAQRNSVIRKSVITAFFTGITFLFIGRAIFSLLGITVDDFKIAGGILLLVIAVSEIVRHKERRQHSPAAGVVPIGVPLIVGPAVLTTLLMLVEQFGIFMTVLSFVVNLFIVWLCFTWAGSIVRFLGKEGILAFSKVMALLLGAIAVMMIRMGIFNLLSQAYLF
ncbi:MAG: MarC family protein [Thermodesulfovibrionales bacterium]|nr:MarC family protein [Thermodesulfovibrionales bacterium]